MAIVDIIIPTVNNPQYLNPCISSLAYLQYIDLINVLIVNNGEKDSVKGSGPNIKVLHAGSNLGWEGGLKLGLENSKSEFVCFLNDDVYFPYSSVYWLNVLLQHFRDPKVGAVGPSCNNIRGAQNIWYQSPKAAFNVSYLIGLCFLARRKAIDEAGGIDDTLPGGDDIDLSMRIRKAGYRLVCDKTQFVYHHLSTTGRRLRSDWDSNLHQEAYNRALWEKHGLKELLFTYNHQVLEDPPWVGVKGDPEADLCKKYIQGDKVYELGCGDTRTSPRVIGVDIIPKGEKMEGVFNRQSDADLTANVFEPMAFKDADCIIARHILEHTHNPLNAIKNWKNSLKHGGRLIVAVPDQDLAATIVMNPQHLSSFTKESLKELMEAAGMKTVMVESSGNPISFVGVWEKNGD